MNNLVLDWGSRVFSSHTGFHASRVHLSNLLVEESVHVMFHCQDKQTKHDSSCCLKRPWHQTTKAQFLASSGCLDFARPGPGKLQIDNTFLHRIQANIQANKFNKHWAKQTRGTALHFVRYILSESLKWWQTKVPFHWVGSSCASNLRQEEWTHPTEHKTAR